jgi:hypothetical protein
MNSIPRDPRAEIIELGSKITVAVNEGGQQRSVSVNVFDPAAPPFAGNSPEVSACNSIKKEVLDSLQTAQTPHLASPSKTHEISKGIEKSEPGISRSI